MKVNIYINESNEIYKNTTNGTLKFNIYPGTHQTHDKIKRLIAMGFTKHFAYKQLVYHYLEGLGVLKHPHVLIKNEENEEDIDELSYDLVAPACDSD